MRQPKPLSLSAHMDAREEPILALAKRLGVAWRTIRDARAGQLRNVDKAIELRDRIRKLDRVRVSLASMLAPDVVQAAHEIAGLARAAS